VTDRRLMVGQWSGKRHSALWRMKVDLSLERDADKYLAPEQLNTLQTRRMSTGYGLHWWQDVWAASERTRTGRKAEGRGFQSRYWEVPNRGERLQKPQMKEGRRDTKGEYHHTG